MAAEGGEYVSRDLVAANERERSAANLRRNKRQIAAQVLREELAARRVPVGVDAGLFAAVVGKLIAELEAGG